MSSPKEARPSKCTGLEVCLLRQAMYMTRGCSSLLLIFPRKVFCRFKFKRSLCQPTLQFPVRTPHSSNWVSTVDSWVTTIAALTSWHVGLCCRHCFFMDSLFLITIPHLNDGEDKRHHDNRLTHQVRNVVIEDATPHVHAHDDQCWHRARDKHHWKSLINKRRYIEFTEIPGKSLDSLTVHITGWGVRYQLVRICWSPVQIPLFLKDYSSMLLMKQCYNFFLPYQ